MFRYRIAKRFEFSASHQLSHLPDGHQCARLHGHNYAVELILEAEYLGSEGFVLDYGQLAPFKEYIDHTFDHRHLNDVLGSPELTTAERLAEHLFWHASRLWPQLVAAVRVSETGKTWATFERID